jgi:hypothetical protein
MITDKAQRPKAKSQARKNYNKNDQERQSRRSQPEPTSVLPWESAVPEPQAEAWLFYERVDSSPAKRTDHQKSQGVEPFTLKFVYLLPDI